MIDAPMSREEIAEFLATVKKLRDDLGLMQAYLGRAVAVVSKTEDSLKDVRTVITEVALRIDPEKTSPRND
jgi:hypothetical protein